MKKKIAFFAASLFLAASVHAQQTYQELEQITVNEQVTTLVTASEPILFVDVSTDKVAGDKPIENTVRFKPKEGGHSDGEVLAIATVVTERYRTQYALVYTTKMEEAVTDKEIAPHERMPYHNPAVSLSTADMTHFARRVWSSPAKIHNEIQLFLYFLFLKIVVKFIFRLIAALIEIIVNSRRSDPCNCQTKKKLSYSEHNDLLI